MSIRNYVHVTVTALVISAIGFGANAQQSKLPPCVGTDYSKWTNCFGKAAAPKGGQYVGEWKNGKPEGKGVMTYADGEKYVGELKDGVQNGTGTFTYPDGRKYVGEWKDGSYSKGTFSFRDGELYVGEWKNGKPDGKGTFTNSSGKYIGEWRDGNKNGQGIDYTAKGAVEYSGLFKDGKRVENKQQTAQAAPAKQPQSQPTAGGDIDKNIGGCFTVVGTRMMRKLEVNSWQKSQYDKHVGRFSAITKFLREACEDSKGNISNNCARQKLSSKDFNFLQGYHEATAIMARPDDPTRFKNIEMAAMQFCGPVSLVDPP